MVFMLKLSLYLREAEARNFHNILSINSTKLHQPSFKKTPKDIRKKRKIINHHPKLQFRTHTLYLHYIFLNICLRRLPNPPPQLLIHLLKHPIRLLPDLLPRCA